MIVTVTKIAINNNDVVLKFTIDHGGEGAQVAGGIPGAAALSLFRRKNHVNVNCRSSTKAIGWSLNLRHN